MAKRNHINVPFEIKSMDDSDEFFYFEGFASTFGNVDLGDDVMVRGAFSDSLAKRRPKLLWQHDMDDPLGVFDAVEETDTGLRVSGRMPKSDTFVSGRVIPQMQVGSVDSMSIGFSIPKGGSIIKDGIRYISKADLWEVSLVTLPMNPAAIVTGMKSVGVEEIESLTERELEEFLRDSANISRKGAKYIASKVKAQREAESGQREAEQVLTEGLKQLLSEFNQQEAKNG